MRAVVQLQNRLIRDMLTESLHELLGLEVTSIRSSSRVVKACAEHDPRLVVMELGVTDRDVVVARALARRRPLRLLGIGTSRHPDATGRLRHAGFDAIVPRTAGFAGVLDACDAALSSSLLVATEPRLPQARRSVLTPREVEVLDLAAAGLTTHETAARLHTRREDRREPEAEHLPQARSAEPSPRRRHRDAVGAAPRAQGFVVSEQRIRVVGPPGLLTDAVRRSLASSDISSPEVALATGQRGVSILVQPSFDQWRTARARGERIVVVVNHEDAHATEAKWLGADAVISAEASSAQLVRAVRDALRDQRTTEAVPVQGSAERQMPRTMPAAR